MNCSEVQESLSAYYDGELSDKKCVRVSHHLEGCSHCEKDLTGFKKLATMTSELRMPSPPDNIWSRLEKQLEEGTRVRPADTDRPLPTSVPKWLVLAVAILITVGIGWLTYDRRFEHNERDRLAAEFAGYLDEFDRDPYKAQQILVAKYGGKTVDVEQVFKHVGYRPAVANGLLVGYRVESAHVMTMPRCKCVECFCTRDDGSKIAIFEHDDEESDWFRGRPKRAEICNGIECSVVELGGRIAVTWKRGTRQITAIGLRDLDEAAKLRAMLEKNNEF